MKIKLPAPNWPDVLGEVSEAAWIADRDRKLGKANKLAAEIQAAHQYLSSKNAVFHATPAVLSECALAARWYVSLAGYSQKTLANIREQPRAFGLTVKASTVVAGYSSRTPQDKLSTALAKHAAPFCKWVNDEIAQKHPATIRDSERALIVVSEILGGRVIGQGQNEGGDIAVVLVKELLVKHLLPDFALEVGNGRTWEAYTAKHSIADATFLRFGKQLVCDFTSGGNRPDIIVRKGTSTIAVGEIKGRKDLSNVWESWMPQVATHMNAWSYEYASAARLFFGTLIVKQMVDGFSNKGTQQIGFRELHKDKKLDAVYNVGNVIAGHEGADKAFRAFVAQLALALKSK